MRNEAHYDLSPMEGCLSEAKRRWIINEVLKRACLLRLTKNARTHFAPAVGLPDFEHGYVPDQVPYASEMNKGHWVTQWAKKYPEKKIVWLEDNAVEFIRTSIETEEHEEEWKAILSSTRILVLAAKIGLEYPRDINLIDAFLQGKMADDEIRLTNQPFLDDLIKYSLRNRWGGRRCKKTKKMTELHANKK